MNFDIYSYIDQDGIYICDSDSDISPLTNDGFKAKTYGNFVLLTK